MDNETAFALVFSKRIAMPLILFIFLAAQLQAGSDPAARKIMDRVHKYYTGLESFEIAFEFEQERDNHSAGLQKGSLISKGQKFKLSLPDIDLYCDGSTQYAHLKKNREVQISKPDETDTKYHPQSLSAIHKNNHYEYRIGERIKKGEKSQTVIEFKPIDREDEVFKIKLFVSESSNQIEKVQWFEKSGQKTTVSFHKTKANLKYPDNVFSPDLKSMKDTHVEDLREE